MNFYLTHSLSFWPCLVPLWLLKLSSLHNPAFINEVLIHNNCYFYVLILYSHCCTNYLIFYSRVAESEWDDEFTNNNMRGFIGCRRAENYTYDENGEYFRVLVSSLKMSKTTHRKIPRATYSIMKFFRLFNLIIAICWEFCWIVPPYKGGITAGKNIILLDMVEIINLQEDKRVKLLNYCQIRDECWWPCWGLLAS